MIKVFCLNTGTMYKFCAKTAYEAMEKMKYTLDLKCKDGNAVINKTEDGKILYMDHSGMTYSTMI